MVGTALAAAWRVRQITASGHDFSRAENAIDWSSFSRTGIEFMAALAYSVPRQARQASIFCWFAVRKLQAKKQATRPGGGRGLDPQKPRPEDGGPAGADAGGIAMSLPHRLHSPLPRTYLLIALNTLLILACGPSVQRPTGLASEYEDAKDMFKRGKFDRALDFTDGLVSGSTPNKFTERACVLRAVIFTGLIQAYKDVSEAYSKGAENAKDPHYRSEFVRLRHD